MGRFPIRPRILMKNKPLGVQERQRVDHAQERAVDDMNLLRVLNCIPPIEQVRFAAIFGWSRFRSDDLAVLGKFGRVNSKPSFLVLVNEDILLSRKLKLPAFLSIYTEAVPTVLPIHAGLSIHLDIPILDVEWLGAPGSESDDFLPVLGCVVEE